MKKMNFLLTAIVVVCMSNLGWTQGWTATGNDVYNTNYSYGTYGTIPLKGKVGIGFNSPINDVPGYDYKAVLQVKGASGFQPYGNIRIPVLTLSADNTTSSIDFGLGDATYGGFIRTTGTYPLNLITRDLNIIPDVAYPGYGNLTVTQGNLTVSNGKVIIGNVTTPTGYKLFVETGILTEKLKVAVKTTSNWADYVFNKDYKLLSLPEVEAYVEANKHLPGVPSAEEVVKEGIDMATMDAKLLEKIEELTLYMIEMKKENETLKKKVNEMEIILLNK